MMLQLFPKPVLISLCFLVCVVLLRYDISDSDEISAPTECLAVKKTLVSCYIISNVNAWVPGSNRLSFWCHTKGIDAGACLVFRN